MANTTLKVKKKTKEMMDKLKVHPRQSYDEIIRKALNCLLKEKNDEKNS